VPLPGIIDAPGAIDSSVQHHGGDSRLVLERSELLARKSCASSLLLSLRWVPLKKFDDQWFATRSLDGRVLRDVGEW
jgi:hypothetical protein